MEVIIRFSVSESGKEVSGKEDKSLAEREETQRKRAKKKALPTAKWLAAFSHSFEILLNTNKRHPVDTYL